MGYRLRQEILFFWLKRPALSSRFLPKVPNMDEKALRGIQLPEFQGHLPPGTVKGLMEGEVFCLGGDRASIERFEAETRGRFFADLPLGEELPDIRLVWEPARLQNVTALLFSSSLIGEGQSNSQAIARAQEALFEWMKKNPFPLGPHYISAMECGLRIPVFVYSLKLMDLSPDQRREILHFLYLHAWWISRRLSLYASRGNHTVCEGLGLVFAGVVFRSFPEGDRWLSLGVKTLRREILDQILPDGGLVEQSLGYHRLILDVYWLAFDFLKKNGIDLHLEWKPLLDKGERFLEAFRQGSYLPAIGDSDDGCVVAPGIHPRRTHFANQRNGIRKAERS
ncbi:MAG: hypothetical protein HXY45_19015 [Syntrophaceae bacterium]|nr:hypothetical protein [Syntrophaceae bacterium]